jgi:hypothetical protein
MELNKTFTSYLRFDRSPYIQERTACGINALIEVLDLPVSKLNNEVLNTSVIGNKLREITGDKATYVTVDGQCIHLQLIIRRLCPDEATVEKVMELCEEKFLLYSKTRSFI